MKELRICNDSDRRRGILIYRRFGTARETQSVQKSLCSADENCRRGSARGIEKSIHSKCTVRRGVRR